MASSSYVKTKENKERHLKETIKSGKEENTKEKAYKKINKGMNMIKLPYVLDV